MSDFDKPAEDSFLSRWSRRKSEANTELPLTNLSSGPESSTDAAAGTKMPETPHLEPTLPAESQPKEALPSIDSLTHDADYSPFMAREVDPVLRNQAMRKLFTDPHYQFEQMDKLDIYIDDYSKPDPIPLDMLRKMNQAARLGLFDDEQEQSPSADEATAPLSSISTAALPGESQEASPAGELADSGVDHSPPAEPAASH